MITNFIENYAKLIVSKPEELTIITNKVDDTFTEITIGANAADIGKLIGKNGIWQCFKNHGKWFVKLKMVYLTKYKLLLTLNYER